MTWEDLLQRGKGIFSRNDVESNVTMSAGLPSGPWRSLAPASCECGTDSGDVAGLEEHYAEEERAQKSPLGLNGKLNSLVRWVSDSLTDKSAVYRRKLVNNLSQSAMFGQCSQASKIALANSMTLERFKKGQVLCTQGDPQSSGFVIVEGSVVRLRMINDQLHQMVSMEANGSAIGMLHLLREEKAYSTVRAVTDGACYRLRSAELRDLLDQSPEFSQEVILSLSKQIRSYTRFTRTPLFLQSGKAMPAEPLPWFAVSCAAAIESFYRAGLNSVLNEILSGKPRGSLFPNMQIQLPTRLLYINGFKGIRHVLDSRVDVTGFERPQLVGLGLAVLPGVAMTPLSSVLEACNANTNKEPLTTRWTRGLIPRCAREVIFGIGINQLSDFFEERMEMFESQGMRNFAGSLAAGVTAGYLSHMPHNLSTLKLLFPDQSYGQLFSRLAKPYETWYGKHFFPVSPEDSKSFRDGRAAFGRYFVPFLACTLPTGVFVRTLQIGGSFVIINSAVNALSHIDVKVSVGRTTA